MGRRVKCRITEEYGDSEDFYKAKDGRYYKSKEIYINYKREDLARRKTNTLLMEFLKLRSYPPMLGKLIKELHQDYSYEVIYLTVVNCKKNIQYALSNKHFNSQFAMIRYIGAILKNNIPEVYKFCQMKKNSKTKKIDIDKDVFENQRTNTKEKKDISKWLE